MQGSTAIIFDNFGPYHWARVEAATSRFPTVAVEVREKTSEYAWERITDSPLLARRTLVSANSPASAKEVWNGTRELLAQLNPKAVAVPGWSSTASLSALDWCLENRRPAIVMSESTAWDEKRGYLREQMKRRILRLFSAAVVGGKPHAQYLESLGVPPSRIQTGYDVVDNDHFARGAELARRNAGKLRAELGLPTSYLLASCRFIRKKNLRRLIEAYGLYRQQRPMRLLSLVILGDGPLRSDLCHLIGALELRYLVKLPGFRQYEELPSYYGLAEGFVHASTTEQWGLVVNEAMASSLPVLVSNRCGCAADLVSDGENGWLFEPTDVRQIEEAFHRLSSASSDQCAAMAEAGRERISHYSPTCFAEGLAAAWRAAEERPLPVPSLFDHLLLRALALRNAL